MASLVPSGEKAGIKNWKPAVPGTRSSRPLAATTAPVAVGASERYLEPGCEPIGCVLEGPPKTTYEPSGVSAELEPDMVVCSARSPAGRSNAAQGRVCTPST